MSNYDHYIQVSEPERYYNPKVNNVTSRIQITRVAEIEVTHNESLSDEEVIALATELDDQTFMKNSENTHFEIIGVY